MSDSDAQQPTEPPGKVAELAPARDQAVADGHHDDTRHGSPSCQLILSERTMGRFDLLRQRHRRRAWTGLVLVNSRGKCHSFPPEQWPTTGELLRKGRGTLYEVDMGLHWTSLELDLPSHEDAFPFHAVIDIEWSVTKPDLVVRNRMNDVREALSPSLHHRLSAITRQFDVEDTAAAETKSQKWLKDHPIGEEYGLKSQVSSLRLQMDKLTADYAEEIRKTQLDIKLEHKKQALELLREKLIIEITARRVEHNRDIILAGAADQFALQLARDPDSVATVVPMVRKEHLEKGRNLIEFATRMVNSGAIEPHEINDLVQPMLASLTEASINTFRGLEQAARIPVQSNFDGLPPADIPGSDLPDPSPVDPVQSPRDAPTHDTGKA